MNKVFLVGNSGAKAELRYTAAKLPIINLSLAVPKSIKQPDGTWMQQTNWVKVTIFGRKAEVLAPLIDKGSKLMIDGELSVKDYQDRDGQKKTSVQVIANEVHVIARPAPQAEAFPPQQDFRHHQETRIPPPPAEIGFATQLISEEDIPF